MLKTLLSYLKYRKLLIAFFLLAAGLTLAMASLSGAKMLYARYTVLLLAFVLLCMLLADGAVYVKKLRQLSRLLERLPDAEARLPEPGNGVETAYAALLSELCTECRERRNRLDAAQNDMLEYYTLWVHQIKTPISAMRLVLQDQGGEDAGVLRQELFKIEQYADLALRFVKLSDIASDLVVERTELLPLVRESVKKFALLFVYQKLSVQIDPMDQTVVTDRRWFQFVLEQVLSNAVKYTKAGGVRIYLEDGALVVADTGIGIRAEDLPRIFEKGYTGYNGRIDTRASGIGLYLAQRTCRALAMGIRVESSPGAGTRVYLTFPEENAFSRE